MTTPIDLRIENLPIEAIQLGIGTGRPRLSWRIADAPPAWTQQAYAVEITRDGRTEVAEVASREQVLVDWPGEPLSSRDSASVRVRVLGSDWSEWSEVVTVEVGLLSADDWSARFVSPQRIGGILTPAPLLAGTWNLPDDIASARLYISAHGLYEARINGHRVGDHSLAPGWTSYQARLRYQTYDVTDLVRSGRNEASALLGNGWYRGRLTWSGERALYGDRLALLAQLEVLTASGERATYTADDSWTAHTSHILADDIYDGQTTDLRITAPQGEDAVDYLDADLGRLVAPLGPPVREVATVPAVSSWRSPSGTLLVDFGQNVVGWVRLTVEATESGRTVTLKHAEVLEDGELGTRPLRTARCTDEYILAGRPAVLEPTFTFHGFRYASIDGLDEHEIVGIEAVVLSSDMARTGWFSSSNELLNRLHENVVWGMRGNFVDVPTDCPQRDERLGWTGDIEVFAPSAQFLFDSTGFLSSWLQDLAADQYADGGVPFVVPDVLRNSMVSAAWGDAATIVPAVLHERSADVGVLARQLPSMRAWVEFLDRATGEDGVWSGGFQFGDWLDPTAPPEEPAKAKADPDVVATAYVVRSAQLLADAARLVGDEECAAYAAGVEARARAGFAREFVTEAGRVLSDSQTAYALALRWGLLSTDDQRKRAASRLADLVRASGFRISTGFVGTPLVTDALADNGHADVAYRLLLQTGCPSWLYPVTMGATTIWERWDSMLPDGTINPGEMTSFNHYALGAVADWLHRSVAGLAPAAPGYRVVRVAPRPGGGLTSASARHLSPYGETAVAWTIADGVLTVTATIPAGATAIIALPGQVEERVGHGTHVRRAPLVPSVRKLQSVRDLMDDPLAWPAFVEGAVAAGVGGMVHLVDEPSVAGHLAPYLDADIATIPEILTLGGSDPGHDRLEAALAEVFERA